jgi:hypothetical protein
MEHLAKALDHGKMDCWALSNEVGEMLLCNVKKVVWIEVCVVNNILLDKVTKEVVLFVGTAGHFVQCVFCMIDFLGDPVGLSRTYQSGSITPINCLTI